MTIEAVAVPAGRGGVALAWRRLRRNPAAIVSAATLIVIVLACFPGAPLFADFACHHGPNDQNIEGFIHQGGHRDPGRARRRHPHRPGLARVLPARRRLERARPRGANPLRRPDLALRRRVIGAPLRRAGARDGPDRGIHRRHRRLGPLAAARPDLVVPGVPARGRARDDARGGRPRGRAAARLVQLARDPDRGDRRRLRALRGPADPRPGAVAAADGVRRGGGGDRRRADADHDLRAAPQHRVDHARDADADRRQQHPRRGGALVPGRRRAGADAVVGQHHRAGLLVDRDRPGPHRRAGDRDHAHRRRAERARRRAA